jgi:hypothetical protein
MNSDPRVIDFPTSADQLVRLRTHFAGLMRIAKNVPSSKILWCDERCTYRGLAFFTCPVTGDTVPQALPAVRVERGEFCLRRPGAKAR